MIKLQVIGNLGKDCLVNNVNGKSVINFSVAHTEKYKDAQGMQKERVTWVECAYWTDRTAVAQYLKKGTQVYVEGTPEVRQFTRTDGTNGATLSLRVLNVQLLGSAKQEGNGGAPASTTSYEQQRPTYSNAPAASEASESIDDLPF